MIDTKPVAMVVFATIFFLGCTLTVDESTADVDASEPDPAPSAIHVLDHTLPADEPH